MERVMTDLTAKREALARTVGVTGMAAHGAGEATVVRVHRYSHAASPQGFVGKQAVQLGKGPLRAGRVGFPLLLRCTFALPLLRTLANISQVFQPDEGMGKTGHDALGNDMIRVLLQPSLPSTDSHQTAGRRTGAFVLQ